VWGCSIHGIAVALMGLHSLIDLSQDDDVTWPLQPKQPSKRSATDSTPIFIDCDDDEAEPALQDHETIPSRGKNNTGPSQPDSALLGAAHARQPLASLLCSTAPPLNAVKTGSCARLEKLPKLEQPSPASSKSTRAAPSAAAKHAASKCSATQDSPLPALVKQDTQVIQWDAIAWANGSLGGSVHRHMALITEACCRPSGAGLFQQSATEKNQFQKLAESAAAGAPGPPAAAVAAAPAAPAVRRRRKSAAPARASLSHGTAASMSDDSSSYEEPDSPPSSRPTEAARAVRASASADAAAAERRGTPTRQPPRDGGQPHGSAQSGGFRDLLVTQSLHDMDVPDFPVLVRHLPKCNVTCII
jgi:hypothetical protein